MLSSDTFIPLVMPTRRTWQRLPRITLALGLALLLTAASALLWASTRTTIVNLGNERHLNASGLLQQWAEGAVIVMIRHAERCDSAPGPCLDDATGITVAGSQAASRVGEGLQHLGLAGADLLSSPKLRTRQTAHFIVGDTVTSEDWLEGCNAHFTEQALAHKRSGHNLVLITHDGCVDHFQRSLSVAPGQRDSAYASALFVSVDGNGKARILGRMNEPDWQRVLATRQR
ncbi:histidine phosphatase family protein [Pseudomonas sp. REB1044]|uniref:lipopolysaccharide core heptose(II)-phosphate phosphatase PmrG n=1 Tax=Pseudomonas sp. REB1044 TaxID=2675224 RepID=UPI00315D6514